MCKYKLHHGYFSLVIREALKSKDTAIHIILYSLKLFTKVKVGDGGY